MSVLDRDTLEASPLADLHAIASELSLDGYRRLRKSALIDALIAHQGGTVAPVAETEPESGAEGESESEDAATEADGAEDSANGTSRRRRGRRGGRGRAAGGREDDADADADDAGPDTDADAGTAAGGADADSEAPAAEAGAKSSGRSRSRSKGKSGDGKSEPEADRAKAEAEPVIVEGVVELLANGSGFVRLKADEQSDDDVYVSAAQVKRCELVSGDRVSGPRREPHRSERYPSLVRIDTVNGQPASELADRARFDELQCEPPSDRFKLESDDATLKAIEYLTPFGRGSRVTITGARWSGKSHTLRVLADALAAQDGVTVLVALAGVRPEEIAGWSQAAAAPKAAVSLAGSSEAQDHAVELVIEQAKRLAGRGEHAVVLIDTLDQLQPLSARRALACARNITGGGSLTVIATASAPFGGETTVITLSAVQASLNKFPAVDLANSGTMNPELLVGKTAANAIVKERAKALK